MKSPARTKTGGRVAGTKNKATLAREAAAATAAPPVPNPDLSPGSRAGARGTKLREVEKDRAAQALNLLGRKPGDLPPIGPTFPRYKLARVDKLIPYANNARTHSADQIIKLRASIREFGFTNPVLTDGKGGIIAGHGRVLAANAEGWDVVPTIELSHLSPEQRRAYIIADNKLALDAGWDDDLLRLELGELRDDGFDLSLTGFDTPELDKLFADDPTGPSDFPGFDENIETEHTCPSCGYKFSGGKTTATPQVTSNDPENC